MLPRARLYVALAGPALLLGVGACGQILGVDGLRGPGDGASDGGVADAGAAPIDASVDGHVFPPEAAAPTDAAADGNLSLPEAAAPMDAWVEAGADASVPDAAPGDAAVYAFLPIGANEICAESIAGGDDTAAPVDGVAPNGTWFVGCDHPNDDSTIYELQDGYKGGITPNAGPTVGRNIAMGAGPNGHAWIVNELGQVFEWTGTSFTLRALPADVVAIPSEQVVGTWQSTIAVDPSNDVWVISDVPAGNGDYYVYYYSSSAGTWAQRTDIYGTQVAVSPDAETVIWTLNSAASGTGVPTAWDLSQTPASRRSYGQCATNIAVGRKNTPWVLDCTVGASASNASTGLRVLLGTSAGVFAPIVDSTGNYFYAASLGMSTATGAPWYVDSRGNVFSGTRISAP